MHTFDIRFAKSVGLAGLFEAPANRLGWKGSGRLSIDAQGIRIAVKRGLLTLFARRARRFSADSLTEAYREGNSLRLVFRSNDTSEVLPVWTRGGDQAAELVKLLPTLRTVELDHATTEHRFRPDWRMISLAVVALIAASGVSLSLLQSPMQSESNSSIDGPAATPGISTRINDGVAPVADAAPETRHPATATGANRAASAGRPGISSAQKIDAPDYQASSEAGDQGSRSRNSSAASQSMAPSQAVQVETRARASVDAARWLLEIFEAQSGNGIDDEGWWQFTVRVYTTPEFQERELWAVREGMLAVSRAWRAHDIEFAQALTWQVQMLIRDSL